MEDTPIRVPYTVDQPIEHQCIKCESCVDTVRNGKEKKMCIKHIKYSNFTSFPFQNTTCKDFKDKTQ